MVYNDGENDDGEDDDGKDDDGENDDGEDDDGEDGTHLLRSLQGQHQGKCKHCCLGQAQIWSKNSNMLADKKVVKFYPTKTIISIFIFGHLFPKPSKAGKGDPEAKMALPSENV